MKAVTIRLSCSFQHVVQSVIGRILSCLLAAVSLLLISQLSHLSLPGTSANRLEEKQGVIRQARLSENISVHAAGRGNPYINLSDGRDVIAGYEGPAELVEVLEQNRAKPLSLASADFDEDGVPDLVSGHAGAGGGILTLYRGNVDSIYPNAPAARQRRASGEYTESPLLGPARAFAVREQADYLQAGDFDGDSHTDIVAAQRGGESLYLFSGDGRGGFGKGREIRLAGRITAMCAGDMNRRDGLTDLVIAIASDRGAKALVYEGPEGALRAQPEEIELSAEASSMAIGQLDEDYPMDLAIAAGREVVMLEGRDRKLSLDAKDRVKVEKVRQTKIVVGSAIRSIAIGDFDNDRLTDISLLSEQGGLEILTRSRPRSNRESRAGASWRFERAAEVRFPGAACLIRGRFSGLPSDDLIVIDSSGQRIGVLSWDGVSSNEGKVVTSSSIISKPRLTELRIEGQPAAAIPMRFNGDALDDLAMVVASAGAVAVATSQPVSTFTVTNTSDSGPGSLRQAILDANASSGADTIVFSIGTGAQTITPSSPLPTTFPGSVTIDATTQPGFAGAPIIELNGASAGTGASGLVIAGGGSTARGLVINRFGVDGIRLQTNPGNIIEGNYIGLDLSGTTGLGNKDNGIGLNQFAESINNTIGGTVPAARNVISDNEGDGIEITFGSTGNIIRGNFIGTDATGMANLTNMDLNRRFGLAIRQASNNTTIGGTTAGARNVISGNLSGGISVSHTSGTLVQSNLIGPDLTGTISIPSCPTGLICGGGKGIDIVQASGNTVGGTVAAARNIISGNNSDGIDISSSFTSANLVQGNFIGTDINGTAALGNKGPGVLIMFNADNNTVGGDEDVPGTRNIISGNFGDGVQFGFINLGVITSNVLQNNFVGTDVTGTLNLGNTGDGVIVPANADGNRIENNRIVFNQDNGVRISEVSGANTPGIRITIEDNLIHSNSILGIDLGPTGVTANDPMDPDIGANNLQNFPILTSVTSANGMTRLIGNLNSAPNSDIFIQFFSSTGCNGSNPGMNQQILTLPVLFHTDSSGNAPIDVTIQATPIGGWVNCVATDATGNSSEFSPCVQVNGCTLSFTPESQSYTASGGIGSISVTAGAGCGWTATTGADWITIDSGSGSGNGTASYTVAANTTINARTGMITIAGQTHVVNQEGATCSYSILPIEQDFGGGGGSSSVNVVAPDGCGWTAVSNDSFILITSGSSGVGNGAVNYTVAANDTINPRSGTMTIAGHTFTVNQALACLFTLDRSSQSFTANAGSGSIQVSATQDCDWTAISNAPWIMITSGGSGKGNGTVNYSVTSNPGPTTRNDTISVAGQTFTVFQGILFNDVPQGHTFFTEIGKLSARGVTLGCGGGNYCPDQPVLRDQMAAFIIRALGDFNPPQPPQQRFPDVPPTNPFYAFIEQMAVRQITLGCGGGNYCPSSPVLRDQMAAFIMRGLGEFSPPEPAQQRFLDVPPQNPFYRFIDRMAVLQITLGCGGGNYCPLQSVTRGQMAAFLVRAFNL